MKRASSQSRKRTNHQANAAPTSSALNALSQTLVVSIPKVEGKGEDFPVCRASDSCLMVAVFDGCGGAGARTYPEFNNATGAYIASRAAAEGLEECFGEDMPLSLAETYKGAITAKLQQCSTSVRSASAIKGSLQKEFPTTAAICAVRPKAAFGEQAPSERKATADEANSPGDLVTNVLWAGDSRCYWLDETGLHQLTQDDIAGNDALENIRDDGALTNMACASAPFVVHEEVWTGFTQGVLFAATDGCFGYLPTPMHFEFALLDALESAGSIDEWQGNLAQLFKTHAGDDATLCALVLGFDSFADIQGFFYNRHRFVQDTYVVPYDANPELEQELWDAYKPDYTICMRCLHD